MYVFKSSIFVIIFFLMSPSVLSSDLVNIEWLNENSTFVKVIDLRSSEQFQTGHIPSAINIPYKQFTRTKNNINGFVETPKAFKALMESNGIKNSDIIVLYSDWSFLDSMRIYWVMDFYGHKQVKVLDGGIQAWVNAKQELSLEEMTIPISHYILEINSHIITTKFRTFMASKNPKYIIVDGRDNKQFNGEESLTDRRGHIPNAINIPWVDLVNNRSSDQKYIRTKTMSTLKNIHSLKEKLSIIPKNKSIILYCNGGQESSVLYFALKELGIKASIYDGSWFEWSNDNNMPVIKIKL